MAQTAKNITSTGQVSTGPTTLWMVTTDAAGDIVLRDTDENGAVKATFSVVAGMIVPVPWGMHFPGGLHATLTTTDNVTFWIG